METQTIETPAQGTPQADTAQKTGQNASQSTTETSEKLYAGKYKAPEELEKGYKELESKHGKTVSDYESKIKEANDRYEQLITQISTRQAAPQAQEEIYETPEEKIQKEVGTLKQELNQMKIEKITEKFLNDHPDLKGDAEQRIAWQRFQELNAAKGQYWPLDRIMQETAELARKDIAQLKERAIKEVTEVRKEVTTQETPRGTPVSEKTEAVENETYDDYIRGRRENFDRTHRLV